jgi:hypothetical protein
MTRTIRLTRIHALNWYGYKDTIPVEGNLLLAGLTGSGKSILMDLIQFVLVGDQRLVRFNQSATGDRSDRSLMRAHVVVFANAGDLTVSHMFLDVNFECLRPLIHSRAVSLQRNQDNRDSPDNLDTAFH